MSVEEWRPIPGYPDYEVSDLGRVKSLKASKPRLLRTFPIHSRYLKVYPSVDGRPSPAFVHRLVLLAFVGPVPPGMMTRHLDGDPQNNHLENLRYGTQAENDQDKVRHGRNWNAAKTHCPQGHPYDDENTLYGPSRRDCRRCHRDRTRLSRARNRETQAA